jgi:predicted  nucleic acid-binding Zn-ribbon protein
MRPVALLAELNRFDVAIDALNARLAQINEALREPAALRSTRAALADAEKELAQWQGVQADREKAQQDASAKLARGETKLYGGKVKDPKELSDLQKDQDQSRRQRAAAEDQLLEALLAVEAATAKRDQLQADLAAQLKEWESTQARLRAEQAKLKGQLPGLQARQTAARQATPPQYLAVYDSLRPRRAGRAVADIDGEECAVCNVAISPNKLEAARYGEELVYCDNCGRLLFGE